MNEVSRALLGAQDSLEALEKTDHQVLEVYRVFLVRLETLAVQVQLAFGAHQVLMAFQAPKVYQVNPENLEQQANLVLRVKLEHLEVLAFLVQRVKKAKEVYLVKQDLLDYQVLVANKGFRDKEGFQVQLDHQVKRVLREKLAHLVALDPEVQMVNQVAMEMLVSLAKEVLQATLGTLDLLVNLDHRVFLEIGVLQAQLVHLDREAHQVLWVFLVQGAMMDNLVKLVQKDLQVVLAYRVYRENLGCPAHKVKLAKLVHLVKEESRVYKDFLVLRV